MKKKLLIPAIVLAAIALIAGTLLWIGSHSRPDLNYIISYAPSVEGTVTAMTADEITVEGDGGLYRATRHTEYDDGRPNCQVGDRVVIYYDGLQESWPMTFNRVFAIFTTGHS